MRSKLVSTWASISIVGLAAAIVAASALRAAEPAQKAAPSPAAGGAKLVPLNIDLPKPLIEGTPKKILPRPTLEPYKEEPRAPFPAPEGVKNVALNKKVTSSDMNPLTGELSLITDGDKDGTSGTYVELGPGTQWAQIDLGSPADIYALVIWHYHSEYRVYHDVVVQASDDVDFVKGVRTIYNNDFDNSSGLGIGKQLEYIEDYRGKLIDAKDAQGQPAKGRYVRLYSKGSTWGDPNHYIEVEVYGK